MLSRVQDCQNSYYMTHAITAQAMGHTCFSSERSSMRVDASSLGLSSPARTPKTWLTRHHSNDCNKAQMLVLIISACT